MLKPMILCAILLCAATAFAQTIPQTLIEDLARQAHIQENVFAMPSNWRAQGRRAVVDLTITNRTQLALYNLKLDCIFTAADFPDGYAVDGLVQAEVRPGAARNFQGLNFELKTEGQATKLKECRVLKADVGMAPR